MTRYQRIRRRYAAEYRYGEQMGRRLHVSSGGREVIAYCRGILARGTGNLGHDKRDACKALYLGALKTIADERALIRRWRL